MTEYLSAHREDFRCVMISVDEALTTTTTAPKPVCLLDMGDNVAAYAPVCPTLIRVNTLGIATADMEQLEYHNRRKPLFPFEEIAA